MVGKLIPTAAQDGDGAMPSAPPKVGGGAKSKNQLKRMKAKAKKLADQGVSKVETREEEEQNIPVSRISDSPSLVCRIGHCRLIYIFYQMPSTSKDIPDEPMVLDINDPALAEFSSVFQKFQGEAADQIMSDNAVRVQSVI